MSDHSISIVPKQSIYPNSKVKAQEILHWLISKDIVKPTLSDCILSFDNGYAISAGAKFVTNMPDELPFDLRTNGLEIVTQRHVFHTGENGMDECICPNCKANIADDWSFIDDWKEQNITCPICKVANDIHHFSFSPEWGFSDLGFTFWNWPDFKDEFISEFSQKLGCDLSIVDTHI